MGIQSLEIDSSRNNKMGNSVKMLALILLMSVIWRDTKGARINAVGAFGRHDLRTTITPVVSGGDNATQSTGLVGTGAITIGGGLGGSSSCPLLYNCPKGDLCCYRHPRYGCLYNDCEPLSSFY